jgi:hypothetical protein
MNTAELIAEVNETIFDVYASAIVKTPSLTEEHVRRILKGIYEMGKADAAYAKRSFHG